MNRVAEAVNRPSDAYVRENSRLSWILVLIMIVVTVVGDVICRIISGAVYDPGSYVFSPVKTGVLMILGVLSYVIICTFFWGAGKLLGSNTRWKKYVGSWGLTFFPNIICAVVVVYTESYYQLFINSKVWEIAFSTLFIGVLYWKIILYIIYLKKVSELKKGRLFVVFTLGCIIIMVMALISLNMGLMVPIL